ncbi:MAG: SAM-dependent DNA methyltransferase [Actinomycetia bacterium]|nr:SAM-dependent DNA methyltransferase [Actinomycetes bacterium]MCP4962585.1 SAM-dependent DNA methyltransferase [Actinomycetes bacterium]
MGDDSLDAVRRLAAIVDSVDPAHCVHSDVFAFALYLGVEASVIESARARCKGEDGQPGRSDFAPDHGNRTALGAWYTPPGLARGLTRLAIDCFGGVPGRVLDPTCGAGVFLLAAADELHEMGLSPEQCVRRLTGVDVDPIALVATAVAIGKWCVELGGAWTIPTLIVHDIVHTDPPDGLDDCDLVVGNPPFLSQLRTRTVRTSEQQTALGAVGYADSSTIVMQRAVDALAVGGVVVLILPRSFLSARDAKPVRDHLDLTSNLVAAWFDDRPMFDASVRVWAPVVRRKPASTAGVVLAGGDEVTPGGRVDFAGWSELGADAVGVPRLANLPRAGVVGDLADVTADFRDWFYELAGAVRELGPDDLSDVVAVLTSGGIEPLESLWGHRVARLAGNKYIEPVVDRAWVESRKDSVRRLAPKVIIANQTRVIEAMVDSTGSMVGSTPTIQATPKSSDDLWRLAAVLASPVASVAAMRRCSGTGLSPKAMRLTAKVVASLPLPVDGVLWSEGADLVRGGAGAREVGRTMNRAYAMGDDDPVYLWWKAQLKEPSGLGSGRPFTSG